MGEGGRQREGQGERGSGAERGADKGGDHGGHVHAHATLEEVARMASEAGVRKLVLTHFRPGTVDEEETRSRMAKIYTGEIHFAQDMQSFSAK